MIQPKKATGCGVGVRGRSRAVADSEQYRGERVRDVGAADSQHAVLESVFAADAQVGLKV